MGLSFICDRLDAKPVLIPGGGEGVGRLANLRISGTLGKLVTTFGKGMVGL